jgi:hypothetical protein
VQLLSLCLKNNTRKVALRGLCRSLRNMTVVFSAILLLFALFSVFQQAHRARAALPRFRSA